jgi:hypothetical protein
MNFVIRSLALNAVLLLGFQATISVAGAAPDCRVGSYRLKDGSLVDIAPSEGETLRWRLFDGSTGALHRQSNDEWRSTYGWTDRPDGKVVKFSDCPADEIDFDGVNGG